MGGSLCLLRVSKRHPKPEPRPLVGGSHVLDEPTGRWIRQDEVETEQKTEPIPVVLSDAADV